MTMKKPLLLLLIFIPSLLFGQDLEKIRSWFSIGEKDPEIAEVIYQTFNEKNDLSPVLIAYRGAAAGLMAKHASNPVTRVRYLRICQNALDSAAVMDPDNFDIRTLRFAIESKTPRILLEDDHRVEDGQIICTFLLRDDTAITPFHSKIASKVIKYEGSDDQTLEILRSKYKTDGIVQE